MHSPNPHSFSIPPHLINSVFLLFFVAACKMKWLWRQLSLGSSKINMQTPEAVRACLHLWLAFKREIELGGFQHTVMKNCCRLLNNLFNCHLSCTIQSWCLTSWQTNMVKCHTMQDCAVLVPCLFLKPLIKDHFWSKSALSSIPTLSFKTSVCWKFNLTPTQA